MGLSDDIKKINTELDKLRKELGKNPLKPFDEKDIDKAREALNGLRTEIREMSSDLDYVSESFKQSVNELSRQNTYLIDARNSLKGIASISDKVLQYRKGEISLSEKQLKNLQQQAKAKFDSLQNDINSGELRGKNLQEAQDALNKQKLFNKELELTSDIQKQVNKDIGLLGTGIGGVSKLLSKMGFGDMSQPLQDAIDKTKNARVQTELNKATQSELNELIKLQGKDFEDLSEDEQQRQIDLEEKYSTNIDKNEQLLQSSKNINKDLESQTSKYKNIGKALKDQLTSVNLIDYAFVKLIEAFGTSQKGIGDLAKGLGMSASSAVQMRQDFGEIANSSMNANVSVKALQESQLAVGQALGTNAKLNDEDLKTMTDIVKKTGLQHSELIGIEKLSLATNKSLDDNVKSALGGATAFASQNKLVVDNNKVLREVNKASSSLKLSLGGSVEALGKAVVQTQKMGINLETAQNMAQGLLNFESSIEAELEAELLTGKDLNFEKARQLSLNGDIAGAAEEVLKQIKGSAEFSKMNVIQQEAMAKAVGMTKDQLADSLIEREALAAMSAEEGETALQAYNKLKESGATEDEIIKKLGDKAAKQLEQQSSQEKFNAALEKAQEIFVQIMDAVAPIFEVLSNIMTTILPAINFLITPILDAFKGISDIITSIIDPTKSLGETLADMGPVTAGIAVALAAAGVAVMGSLVPGLIRAGVAAAASLPALISGAIAAVTSASAVTLGIGAIAIAAGIAGVVASMTYAKSSMRANDMMDTPGYGKRTLFGPEGEIKLNDNDTIIAGTNLFGGDKNSNNTPSQQPTQTTQASVDMTSTNALLQQLISVIQSGGNVMLDGQQVGTALKLGTYQTQ